jgi:acetyl-CoA carboxylase carboxyltransferase component
MTESLWENAAVVPSNESVEKILVRRRLAAREWLDLSLDPESFVETGQLAIARMMILKAARQRMSSCLIMPRRRKARQGNNETYERRLVN